MQVPDEPQVWQTWATALLSGEAGGKQGAVFLWAPLLYLFVKIIYLFIRDTEREREAETQAEG